jgi:hypothetical protein
MHWGYVIAGYGIVIPAVALYALAIVQRGRRLSARVPEDKRRYLD